MYNKELARNPELARAVDVMMVRAKRIYNLMIKLKKLFSFFSSRCFLKEIDNMFSVFLSIRKSCGNTRPPLMFPQHFSFSQTSTRVTIPRQKHGTCFVLFK